MARTSMKAGVSRRLPGGRLLLAALIALAAAGAQAQQASMEERLRTQLRLTTAQLQQVQNELAALKANPAPTAAPTGELEALQRDLAKERAAREALENDRRQSARSANSAVEKANAQVAQYRQAYDELLKLARASEAERKRLAEEDAARQAAIGQCTAKNQQLYTVAQDILRAYETVDLGTVLSARQPFAAQSRVRLEEAAQLYGDKLYQGRFDPAAAAQAQPAE